MLIKTSPEDKNGLKERNDDHETTTLPFNILTCQEITLPKDVTTGLFLELVDDSFELATSVRFPAGYRQGLDVRSETHWTVNLDLLVVVAPAQWSSAEPRNTEHRSKLVVRVFGEDVRIVLIGRERRRRINAGVLFRECRAITDMLGQGDEQVAVATTGR